MLTRSVRCWTRFALSGLGARALVAGHEPRTRQSLRRCPSPILAGRLHGGGRPEPPARTVGRLAFGAALAPAPSTRLPARSPTIRPIRRGTDSWRARSSSTRSGLRAGRIRRRAAHRSSRWRCTPRSGRFYSQRRPQRRGRERAAPRDGAETLFYLCGYALATAFARLGNAAMPRDTSSMSSRCSGSGWQTAGGRSPLPRCGGGGPARPRGQPRLRSRTLAGRRSNWTRSERRITPGWRWALAGSGRLAAATEEYQRAATLGADPVVLSPACRSLAKAGRASARPGPASSNERRCAVGGPDGERLWLPVRLWLRRPGRHRPRAAQPEIRRLRWAVHQRPVHRGQHERRRAFRHDQRRQPREIPGRRPSVPAGCSSTTTTTDGSTSSWSMAARSPAAIARQARHRLYQQSWQRHVRRRDRGIRYSSCAATAWARAPATTTVTAASTCTSRTSARTRSTATPAAEPSPTSRARLASGAPVWSTSCAFADLDKDGDLDLFVDELRAAVARHNPFCGNARRARASIATRSIFQPRRTSSTATMATATSRTSAASPASTRSAETGSASSSRDFDDDSWPDVFVANDAAELPVSPHRRVALHEDVALPAGVAVATDGKARAGMGTDAADYDGDGRMDLVVTNLVFETFSLFRGSAIARSRMRPPKAASDRPTLPFVGFGAVFARRRQRLLLDRCLREWPLHRQPGTVPPGRFARAAQSAVPEHRRRAASAMSRAARAPALRWKKWAAAWLRATSTTTAIWICRD